MPGHAHEARPFLKAAGGSGAPSPVAAASNAPRHALARQTKHEEPDVSLTRAARGPARCGGRNHRAALAQGGLAAMVAPNRERSGGSLPDGDRDAGLASGSPAHQSLLLLALVIGVAAGYGALVFRLLTAAIQILFLATARASGQRRGDAALVAGAPRADRGRLADRPLDASPCRAGCRRAWPTSWKRARCARAAWR